MLLENNDGYKREREMKLISVNIGRKQSYDPTRPEKKSGIFKRPVSGPVEIDRLGLEGDAIVNRKHHGGPDQAVYLYTMDDYAFWADDGIDVEAGLFGENLTIEGVESATLCAGDRLKFGNVTLEITAPRVPCNTFAAKMGDPAFVKRFRDAGRPGAYARVIAQGQAEAGQAIAYLPAENRRMSLGAQFALHFEKRPTREQVETVLSLPVAIREREHYAELLEKLELRS